MKKTARKKPKAKWWCWRPYVPAVIIPMVCFLPYVFISKWFENAKWLDWATLIILFLAAVSVLRFFVRLFFPRIVVTIKNVDSNDELKNTILWADGKKMEICEGESTIQLPIQFSFWVWRRAKYQLCLDIEGTEPIVEEANTYEHMVYHVTFPKENKQQSKVKGS